ncbi:N-acetyltransferase [Paenibacillus sp. YN15]|uniref:GNAT family N-acetyltransferase n=1 Tax=Paenibacillus sp. YN15 TaxID=1742774 RepID=UPI0011BEAF9E|nr:GNAT family N-acetyltransferase [Paenibacillus sp. YN15]
MAEEIKDGNPDYSYCSSGEWDGGLWEEAKPIYAAAFPEHGRKPERIVRAMFRKGMCRLHAARLNGEPAAMALSGPDTGRGIWVIDYLAVADSWRGQGIGKRFLDDIRAEAEAFPWCRGIVVEAEAEETEVNLARIRFWQACGFQLTGYVHHYIWVPEPYRALALSFPGREALSLDGRELFKAITAFHERAYRK